MTERDAFKVGFLQYVAEQGLTPSEFHKRSNEYLSVEKTGGIIDTITKGVSGVGGLITGGAGQAAGLAATSVKGLALLALLTPLAGGFTTGKMHSMLKDVGPGDIDQLKQQQLISEYRRQARQVKTRAGQEGWRSLFKNRADKNKEEELFGA